MRASQISAQQWPSWPRIQQPIAGWGLWIFVPLVSLAAFGTIGAFTAVRPMMAAIVIAGVPAVALALAPRYRFQALLAIFVLAPLMPYMRVFTGIRSGPVIVDIAFLIVVLSLFADRLLVGRLRLTRVHLAVGAFIALGLVQLLNPTSPGLRQGLEGFRILVLPALGFFVGYWLIDSTARLRWAMLTVAAVATLIALYGIKQGIAPNALDYIIVDGTTGSSITYTSLGRFRAFATLSSPSHLAFLMNATILLLFSLFMSRMIRSWQLAGGVAAAGVALLLTIVRVGWIGTGIGLVVLVALAPRFIRWSSTVRLVVVAAVTVGLMAYVLLVMQPDDAISTRFRSLGNLPQEQHYVDRVTSWEDTIVPAIKARPLGYGMGADSTNDSALFFAHNGYFYIAIEMGVVGAVLAVGILIWALQRAARQPRTREEPAIMALRLWILSWTVALLVMGTFGPMLEVYPINLYYWCFLGCLVGLTASNLPLRPKEESTT